MSSLGFPSVLASLAVLGLFVLRQDEAPPVPTSGIATLYAHDDLSSSFDFRNGSAGGRVWDGEVQLTQAQILFDVLAPGQISFGFSRDERVDVLDLGPLVVPPRVRARDRALEFELSIVHTLFLGPDGFAYVGPGGDVDPLPEAEALRTLPLKTGIGHVEPVVGHTYLVRVRRNGTSLDEYFKFEVIGILPGHSLTLRWARLTC
jgi:hypothetical protein